SDRRPCASFLGPRASSHKRAPPLQSATRCARKVRPMFSRNFWLYLASRFSTATAMMMLRAAVAWHVYALSRSAFLLGLIGLVQFVPALALTLVGGALADSYDRRRIMMRAQVVPLVSAAALFLATRSGAVTLPLLYGVILL